MRLKNDRSTVADAFLVLAVVVGALPWEAGSLIAAVGALFRLECVLRFQNAKLRFFRDPVTELLLLMSLSLSLYFVVALKSIMAVVFAREVEEKFLLGLLCFAAFDRNCEKSDPKFPQRFCCP
jgi:hypothetical protein